MRSYLEGFFKWQLEPPFHRSSLNMLSLLQIPLRMSSWNDYFLCIQQSRTLDWWKAGSKQKGDLLAHVQEIGFWTGKPAVEYQGFQWSYDWKGSDSKLVTVVERVWRKDDTKSRRLFGQWYWAPWSVSSKYDTEISTLILKQPDTADRRKIRMIEGNAKCCYLKKWPVKELCGGCLSVGGPLPS